MKNARFFTSDMTYDKTVAFFTRTDRFFVPFFINRIKMNFLTKNY